MKKKIISLKQFKKKRDIWRRKIYFNKNIRKLKKKLYVETDKLSFYSTHSWLDEPILQTPEDIITQQEIIYKTKPEVIIEVGVCWGGSILFYNMLSKILPIKKIIGIDIFIPKNLKKRLKRRCDNKLLLIENDSTDEVLIDKLKKMLKKYKNFYIHLDSNHTYEHVLKELNLYSKFLNKNNYIVADDTIIDEIPNQTYRSRPWNKSNNPMKAVKEFLKKNKNFKINKKLNHNHLISSAPNGYIYRQK
jgi:cephalosporin hydroxylase